MAKRPEPIIFQTRPAARGLNVSEPPQSIDMRESPNLMNVRFNKGQIRFRDGFKLKYPGCILMVYIIQKNTLLHKVL